MKWDNEKKGGRYFECLCYNGKNVVCHDDDRGAFDITSILPLRTWKGGFGKACIAYFDNQSYAFSRVVVEDLGSEYSVLFDDGDKRNLPKHLVYSKESV